MSLPPGLLEAVKNYLDITWDDRGDESSGIIARGMQYLNKVAGRVGLYEEDKPRTAFDYCNIFRSNALDEFQINYQHGCYHCRLNRR